MNIIHFLLNNRIAPLCNGLVVVLPKLILGNVAFGGSCLLKHFKQPFSSTFKGVGTYGVNKLFGCKFLEITKQAGRIALGRPK